MTDKLDGQQIGWKGPYRDYIPVTPDNNNDLPGGVTQAIIVGGAGAVVMTNKDGVDRTATLAAGVHYLRVVRIKATGTTATNIVALYI